MKHLLFCLTLLSALPASAAVTLVDANDWKVDMSGFVELDTIRDDTRSTFVEVMGNGPVARPDAANVGAREQFSIRNTRLAFNLQAPTFEGWKSRAYYEFDFLGFDPSAGLGSSSTPVSASDSEGSFFNSPSLRTRHVYLNAEKDGWQILAGQTWALFGWQPYYFMPTIQVSPVSGMLFSRTAQVRGVKTMQLSDDQTLQVALGIMRPPQRDAGLPAAEIGARWAMNSWSAAYTGGAVGAHKPQPLSVGVSGTVRQFEAPNSLTGGTPAGVTTTTGSAVAIDTLIPIIPSSDGKSSSNNLVLGGEFTIGQGDGDQFQGWTGGQSNPINVSKINLDAGIGGFDNASNFGLFNIQTFNLYMQYHLPESWSSWASIGYGQLNSVNASTYSSTNSGVTQTTAPYYKSEVAFANFSHDFTPQIRAGVEYARMSTTYVDGTFATDNRFQLSTWFIF